METNELATDKYLAAERCVFWLSECVRRDASGEGVELSNADPRGRFWLGRLAPRLEIANSPLGQRAERLEPCAVGLRFLANAPDFKPTISFEASFVVWSKPDRDRPWQKLGPFELASSVEFPDPASEGLKRVVSFENNEQVLAHTGLLASVEVEVTPRSDGLQEVAIQLVNNSDYQNPASPNFARSRLFEASLRVNPNSSEDYLLEALPDSFRYDRRVPAWGINCGVGLTPDGFETRDLPEFNKKRPTFWTVNKPIPDLTFSQLANDPVTSSEELLDCLIHWGENSWTEASFGEAEKNWSEATRAEFEGDRAGFALEVSRILAGIELLKSDPMLNRAFRLMNEAILNSARDADGKAKYDRWRPFQIGFMLANLGSCKGEDTDTVDIVWFPTGGGKTETYLGLILTAAFFDRMRGKTTGITAWSRFPLRLLSLQQTQRFANALAAAELVRRREEIAGDPFGLGFLIGGSSTPNEIKDTKSLKERGEWDFQDLEMPRRLQMVKVCPFCKKPSIDMKFRVKYWRIEHRCSNIDCSWDRDEPLPIWCVDTEIWRYLPTVVVGTLDKAAGIAFQTNMRGMVGAPKGFCPEPGHGHTYATRYDRPHGCLHPRCSKPTGVLPIEKSLYGPRFRLQDELHLLRDSLGAVDAHYEAIFDHFQEQLGGTKPKILASSATLSGYDRQAQVLYNRKARVFPHPEPMAGKGFWSGPDKQSMRRFLAVAPRGQTIEFALDRMIVSLQSAIRRLVDQPEATTLEFGVHPKLAPFLVDLYGTNVVYGNTLRDLDAVVRSAETQWGDIPSPLPNVVSLTGRTMFGEVSETLDRLESPEEGFEERLHVVAASSMMSHGVDVDRLNVMVMLGLPLTTAEYIQATARVGRRWPSLVLVVHKIARERDASIYRSFPQYVDQGDRFVEPIPITGKSRRVLERTLPGLAFARILMMHEPEARGSLWKAKQLRAFIDGRPEFSRNEIEQICEFLGYMNDETAGLSADVCDWYERFMENVADPAHGDEWTSDLGPGGKYMLSLRDVEEQVPVWGADPT